MAMKASKFPPKPSPGQTTTVASNPDIEQLKRDATHYRESYWREQERSERLQCLLDAAGAALARRRRDDDLPF